MKAKDYLVLEMCIKNGIDWGWARAHKHTDTPDENLIKQEMEAAIEHEINEWFDFDDQD